MNKWFSKTTTRFDHVLSSVSGNQKDASHTGKSHSAYEQLIMRDMSGPFQLHAILQFIITLLFLIEFFWEYFRRMFIATKASIQL